MSGRLKIHLKANERLFVNGGVLRVDRKVAVEFMNDVAFLLEAHVVQLDEATTPLKQLYYIVQSILIDPDRKQVAYDLYEQSHYKLLSAFRNQDVLEGLVEVKQLLGKDRPFDALKRIRVLFKIEEQVLRLDAAARMLKSNNKV